MPRVTYVAHNGAERTIDVPVGENVMRGALYNGIDGVIGECGGGMSCATCHVYVDEAWAARTGSRSDMEEQMLDAATSEVKPNSRLGCQITMTAALNGLVVRIPETQF